jgi:hypothetical protein
MQIRPWLVVLAGLTLVASFLITLRWTEPVRTSDGDAAPGPDPVELLRRSAITSQSTLAAAARKAGFERSEHVRGHIDAFKRLDAVRAEIVGWAADRRGDGSPLTIVAFAGGRGSVLGKTQGPRDDVTKELKLSAAAAKNVGVRGAIECKPGERVVVVAISWGYAYSPIMMGPCPQAT